MITAERVQLLTSFTCTKLVQVLEHSGHKDHYFKTTEFVGITNGGEFAYRVTFPDDLGTGKDGVSKVYVSYDTARDEITAGF